MLCALKHIFCVTFLTICTKFLILIREIRNLYLKSVIKECNLCQSREFSYEYMNFIGDFIEKNFLVFRLLEEGKKKIEEANVTWANNKRFSIGSFIWEAQNSSWSIIDKIWKQVLLIEPLECYCTEYLHSA